MVLVVEMARGKPNAPEFKFYSCGGTAWEGLLSTARSFGWVPMGTVPDADMAKRNKDYKRSFKPNYEPEEWSYCKRISDADALNLATALKSAAAQISEGDVSILERPGPLLLSEDRGPEETLRVNQMPTALLKDFAHFCEGGGFTFAGDD